MSGTAYADVRSKGLLIDRIPKELPRTGVQLKRQKRECYDRRVGELACDTSYRRSVTYQRL